MADLNFRVRRPVFAHDKLISAREQNLSRHNARAAGRGFSFAWPDDNWDAIIRPKLPEPHENGAARIAAGGVGAAGRVADIGSGREIARFILKYTVQHKKLLTPGMRMAGEAAAGCIADDGSGTSLFRANPKQHAAVNAGGGAWDPVQLIGVNQGCLG